MMRWLSQLWVCQRVDAGSGPSALWRLTFGRLGSHRAFNQDMRELDDRLKRQAASQNRAIAREVLPVGRYEPRQTASSPGVAGPVAGGWGWALGGRLAMTVGAFAAVGAGVWLVMPGEPAPSPMQQVSISAEPFARAVAPLTQRIETTGRAMREQTERITQLPGRLPTVDRVMADLGESIQTPIRQEARRLADDLRRPWVYLADQMPRLPRDPKADTEKG
jgi:hypothetical protein